MQAGQRLFDERGEHGVGVEHFALGAQRRGPMSHRLHKSAIGVFAALQREYFFVHGLSDDERVNFAFADCANCLLRLFKAPQQLLVRVRRPWH